MHVPLIVVVVVIMAGAEQRDDREQVAHKFLEHHQRFHEVMRNVSATIETRFDAKRNTSPQFFLATADIHVLGDERLVRRRFDRTQSSSHYENFDEIVECRRDDLGFTLNKAKNGTAYSVKQLVEETGPDSKINFAVAMSLDNFLFAPTHVYDVDGALLFRECASALRSCQRLANQGREQVELQWRFDDVHFRSYLKNYREIRVVLDPDADYSIAKFEIRLRSKPGVLERRTGQIEAYRHPTVACWLPKQVVIHDETVIREKNERFESLHTGKLTDYVFGKVTPADLSLERFGIPEPRRRGDARPASFWLLLAAGGLLLLGAGWRWLRRKRTAG